MLIYDLQNEMANPEDAVPQNVEGRFYVDDSCIYCDFCKQMSSELFEEEKSQGWAYVKKQPVTSYELELMNETIEGCPTESIGEYNTTDQHN